MIQSAAGAMGIVDAVYKREPLSTVSDVYQDFMNLLNLKRGPTEMFRNYASLGDGDLKRYHWSVLF